MVERFHHSNSFPMKSVVVPVDFSKTSAIATKFGAYLAKSMNCDLHIVHVSDLVLSGPHSLTTPEQKKDEKKLKEQLAKFAQVNTAPVFKPTLGHTTFIPIVNLSILSGMVAKQLLSLSKESNSAIIVMGGVGVGAGAGTHAQSLYGSVATPVASRSKCPEILIPKGYAPKAISKIAIAFDDADEIIRIGQFSKTFIEALRPEVRYVHVSKADWREELKNENDFMDLTRGKDVPPSIYESDLLPLGDVANQLSHYVDEKKIDLLILGGKRRGFWRRLFDTKHLKPIIRAGKVPMMIIPFSADDG
jgi:nucleotide-binding universal stress UspA family protein